MIIIIIIPFIYIAYYNHYALCTLHTQLHTYMHYKRVQGKKKNSRPDPSTEKDT